MGVDEQSAQMSTRAGMGASGLGYMCARMCMRVGVPECARIA